MGPEQNYGTYQTPNYNVTGQPQNKTRKIVFGSLFVIGIISIVLFIFTLLFSSPGSKSDMAGINAMHQEIARVAELGLESDRARRSTQNLAATTRVIALGNQNQIGAFASANYSSPFTRKSINSELNPTIDVALDDATQSNNYDDEFSRIMKTLLETTNAEIIRVFEVHKDNDQLTDLLNTIGANNQTILDSIED